MACRTRPSCLRSFGALSCGLFALAAPAHGLDVASVDILARISRTDGMFGGGGELDGYFLDVDVFDQDLQLSTGTVTIPGGTMLTLEPDIDDPGVIEATAGPFASLAELQAMAQGPYSFVLAGGARTGSLAFNESVTDSFVEILSPQHLEAGVSSQPTIQFINGCTNCDVLVLVLSSFSGGALSLQSPLLSPAATSFQFSEVLPDDQYLLSSFAVRFGSTTFPSFGTDSFEYNAIFAVTNFIVFTVPEPGSVIAGLTALATVGALGRRKTRRSGLRQDRVLCEDAGRRHEPHDPRGRYL